MKTCWRASRGYPLALAVALATAFGAVSGRADDDKPLFSRPEPALVEGVEALERQDYDGAAEAYRRAAPKEREQRAVVEYNVGAALLDKARKLKEQTGQAPVDDPTAPIEDLASPVYTEASEALGRAFDLSANRELRSDAALAKGNAPAESGDLKGAVKSYRRAVAENPENGRAIANLRSALRMLKAQPPPPSSEGGEDDEKEEGDEDEEQKSEDNKQQTGGDKESDGEEKQDGEQGEGEGESDSSQDDERKDAQKGPNDDEQKPTEGSEQKDEKNDDEQQQGGQRADQRDDEKRDHDKNDRSDHAEGEEQEGDDKGEPSPSGGETDENKDKEKGPAPGRDEDKKKEEARRILDAMRQNEKPLHPFQMRGQNSRLLPPEKPW